MSGLDDDSPRTGIDAGRRDRARGALWGLALGDALGMPTQSFSREQIRERFGRITALVDAPDDQPIAPGMLAGSVTDDTEQALLVGRLLVEGRGRIDPLRFASALIDWEAEMIRRGSRDLLGPSTKAALTRLQEGAPPEETGRYGTTNGAGMRIAPVGVAVAPGPALQDAVVQACQVTHATGLGISGATAVAFAVSSAIDGADAAAAVAAGVAAAEHAQALGSWVAGASIPARYRALRPLVRASADDHAFTDVLYDVVGTSVQSQESVVSALLIVDRFDDRPFDALCTAASLGGDTDTIGAMAGAILGALHGADSLPAEALAALDRANPGMHDEIETLADDLLDLRDDPPGAAADA